MTRYEAIKEIVNDVNKVWSGAGYTDRVFSVDSQNRPLRITAIYYLISIIEQTKEGIEEIRQLEWENRIEYAINLDRIITRLLKLLEE